MMLNNKLPVAMRTCMWNLAQTCTPASLLRSLFPNTVEDKEEQKSAKKASKKRKAEEVEEVEVEEVKEEAEPPKKKQKKDKVIALMA